MADSSRPEAVTTLTAFVSEGQVPMPTSKPRIVRRNAPGDWTTTGGECP